MSIRSPVREALLGPPRNLPVQSSFILAGSAGADTIPIVNPGDDGDYNGGFDNSSNEVELGNTGTSKKGFFYFRDTGIPQGVAIDAAYLIITSSANLNNVTVNLVLNAADEDDPEVPLNKADAEGRPRTSAEVEWSNVAAWTANTEYQSPDISSVIQELVNRPGFAADNILIFVEDNGSTVNASRKGRSYNGDPAQAALLYVQYRNVAQPPIYPWAWPRASNRIDVSWLDTVTAETGFRVYRSTDAVNYAEAGTVGAGVTTFSDTGLSAETTYYYYIVAYVGANEGIHSGVVNATTFASAPTAGSIIWVKSDTGTYQDVAGTTPATGDGEVVGRWEDQSGNGNHFTSVTDGTQRPTLQLNEVNSLPVIRADGVNDYLRTVGNITLTNFTISMVVVPQLQHVDTRLLYQYDGGDGWYVRNDKLMLEHFNTNTQLDGAMPTGKAAVVTVSRGGGTLTLRINGAEAGTAAISVPTTIDEIFMFIDVGLARPTQADMAEVLVYDSLLSAAEIATNEEYLLGRYLIGQEAEGAQICWLASDTGTYEDVAGTTPAADDGDVVGRWEDQSGVGYHFTSVTDGTQRPTLQLNEVNGLPVIRADGVNDYLRSISNIWLTEFTLVLVTVPRMASDDRFIYHYDGSDGWYLSNDADPSEGFKHFTPNANIEISLAGQPTIYTLQRTTTELVIRANGVEIGSTPLASIPTTADEIFLMNDSSAAHPAQVDIAELIIRRGNSSNRINRDEAYLADRYDIILGYARAVTELTTPTYDGSGEAIHPSVRDAGHGNVWPAVGAVQHRYWMAMTPYPAGVAAWENPSILSSDDNDTWAVPAGLANPIDPNPGGGNTNSDTHLLLAQDGKLYCYYREVGVGDDINVRSSSDGVNWSGESGLLSGALLDFCCPTVAWDGSEYVMWVIDASVAPNVLNRYVTNDPDSGWGFDQACTLNNTPAAYPDIWNLDVLVLDGGSYLGLFHMVPNGATNGGHVYWATSADGVTWTLNTYPVLFTGSASWLDTTIYRSCLVELGDDEYEVWVSGSQPGAEWHTGTVRLRKWE